MKYPIEIGKLISKKLISELTPDEHQRVDEWLSDKENAELYDSISLDKLEDRMTRYQNIDSSSAYNKFVERTNTRRIEPWRVVMKFAAIFIMLFSIGTAVYLISDMSNQQREHYTNKIEPGDSKAILVLADGTEVDLNKDTETLIDEKNAKISNEDACLEYIANIAPSKEELYNTLKVPQGGEYKITLSDGTHVWLNAESQLKFPIVFIGETREVELVGEAFFEVAHNASQPFIVKSNKQDIKVLGTAFNVSAYPDEEHTVTTLVSGSIKALFSNEQNQMMHKTLTPEQQLVINNQNRTMQLREVDTYLYSSWKDGRFVFRDEELGDILQEMERWYGFDVVYGSEFIKHHHFSIDIKKYASFEKVVEILELTGLVDLEVNGKVVVAKSNV